MYFDYNGHLHDICVDTSSNTAADLGLRLSRPLAVYQLNMNPEKTRINKFFKNCNKFRIFIKKR